MRIEANADGLVGPTHNYAGLAHGNVASDAHRGRTSSPRRAALEGLAKMRLLADAGVPQLVLPPQERPSIESLRRLGFRGAPSAILERVARDAPALLSASASASAMWTANAATVIPSADSIDGRTHFVVANLEHAAHRALEAPQTARTLRSIFRGPSFVVHDALALGHAFGDEGAANHTRFDDGTHLFVWGRHGLSPSDPSGPKRFPGRQSREASEAVARIGNLREGHALFARQSAEAIDAGVFHHDVIGVGHARTLLVHERAFAERDATLDALRRRVEGLVIAEVREQELALAEAVSTYLFNGQLVTVPSASRPSLIAPVEVRESVAASRVVEGWLADGTLHAVHYVDLRQSMRNGGGPACLRLRVSLAADELAAVAPGVRFDAALHARLVEWVTRHYRDELGPADLGDPHLLDESRAALDELTVLLGLGAIYPFQLGDGVL